METVHRGNTVRTDNGPPNVEIISYLSLSAGPIPLMSPTAGEPGFTHTVGPSVNGPFSLQSVLNQSSAF